MNIENNKRYRGFVITYVPPTTHRGTRIRIKDTRFDSVKMLDYDYASDGIEDTAIKYLSSKLGIDIIGVVLSNKGNILLTDNFHNDLI